MVAALVLALSWQSFVTQTHRHSDPLAASIAAGSAQADSGAQKPGKPSPSDLPANCSICRQMANAGAALLPAPVAIAAPAYIAFHPATAPPLGEAAVQRSHRWQSRAPPTFQA